MKASMSSADEVVLPHLLPESKDMEMIIVDDRK